MLSIRSSSSSSLSSYSKYISSIFINKYFSTTNDSNNNNFNKEKTFKRKIRQKRNNPRSLLGKQYSLIKKQHSKESLMIKELESLPTFTSDKLFNNHFIDFSKIDVYGFDFDFVLACYSPALQPLIYNLVKDIMVRERKYPSDFLNFEYDPSFAIRGLHFDCKQGVLMKLDFVRNINIDTVYFGRNKLQPHQIVKRYPGLHLQQQYVFQNMRHICDLFELSECTILADIVQYFTEKGIKFDPASVYRDVNKAVQRVHLYHLHDAISNNIENFVERKPELGNLLAKIRSEGKTTFMLTNNTYKNVDYLMEYIVPNLPTGYNHWNELFDVVMTNADKPNFFNFDDRPFRQLNDTKDALLWTPVTKLERGQVYRDGCIKEMEKITKWGHRNVLYMGDHIRNDLIDAVKHWGWRTCAIIKELEEAVTCHNSIEYRTTLSFYERISELYNKARKQLPDTHPLLKRIDRKSSNLAKELMSLRHPNFGCVFKSGTKETVLAYQLLRFADIYTSRVENILQSPATTKLIPKRRLMAHDISITPYLFVKE